MLLTVHWRLCGLHAVLLYSAQMWSRGHCKPVTGGDWMPSIIDANNHPPDKVIWPYDHVSNQEVISKDRIILHGDIISCRRLGLFGHVARLDSGVPARDALKCAYARHTEIRPLSGWRSPPGCPRQTWLHQICDGFAASIRQEWDLAVGHGNFQRTKSALWASAAQVFWWWWCYKYMISSA